MAIIGFIVLLLIGAYFAFCAIGGAMVSVGFSGKFPWAYSGLFALLSALVFYFAFHHAPFTITFAGA